MIRTFAWSLLCALMLLCWGASSAQAEEPTPWREIGSHPVNGRIGNLDQLHRQAHGLPTSEFHRGVAMQQRGQCATRQLQDDEVLWTSFFRDGHFGVEHKVVAFGPRVPLNDPRRTTEVCTLGNGVALLLPRGCGNWSVQYHQVQLPPPPVEPQCTCRSNDSRVLYEGTSLSGTYLPGCDPVYMPGLATRGFVDGGQGTTCTCR